MLANLSWLSSTSCSECELFCASLPRRGEPGARAKQRRERRHDPIAARARQGRRTRPPMRNHQLCHEPGLLRLSRLGSRLRGVPRGRGCPKGRRAAAPHRGIRWRPALKETQRVGPCALPGTLFLRFESFASHLEHARTRVFEQKRHKGRTLPRPLASRGRTRARPAKRCSRDPHSFDLTRRDTRPIPALRRGSKRSVSRS